VVVKIAGEVFLYVEFNEQFCTLICLSMLDSRPFKLALLISFLLLSLLTEAQTFSGQKYGVNIGLLIVTGTHFVGIGILSFGYYTE
jgi:hypothetical protein